jgi:hypothetical protein
MATTAITRIPITATATTHMLVTATSAGPVQVGVGGHQGHLLGLLNSVDRQAPDLGRRLVGRPGRLELVGYLGGPLGL